MKPTVTLPDGLVTMGRGAEDSTNVTRNREFVADGKKLDGDDDSDGGVTGDDDEEDGDPDCPELTKKLGSATRETWKEKNSDFRSMKHAVLQTACTGKGKSHYRPGQALGVPGH